MEKEMNYLIEKILEMKKEDIVDQYTLYDYCYQKAKKNVIKTWNLTESEIEEVELDLTKLKVEIKEFSSPFTGKLQKYYFFNYDGEDIFIEDYDSTSETYVEKIVKKLKE